MLSASPETHAVPAPPSAAGRIPSVLVVDDEASVRLGCVLALRSDGWSVMSEAEPRAALARLRGGERFDVLVLDYAMPELDGLTLAAEIAGATRPPILLASAHADGAIVLRALRLGIWDFQAKPLLPAELRRRVRRLLNRRADAEAPDGWLPRVLGCCNRCAWAEAIEQLRAWPDAARAEPADLVAGLVHQLAGDGPAAAAAFARARWSAEWPEHGTESFTELARRLG